MTPLTIVRELPEQTWRCFVARHPLSTVFHTPEMFQVFSRTKGHKPELWAATNGGRVLAMLLPVQVTLMDGLMRYLTTRSIAYGSVLWEPTPEGEEALDRLLKLMA